jgi:uncharacterized membrane protein
MKNNKYDEQTVNTRVKIAGLWTSMLFVFAYVDIFAFFRKDILESALSGKVGDFEANQLFFTFTTLYILIPCIVLFMTLILKAKTARMMNIIVGSLYILTIIGAAAGEEWIYYILGSAVEVLLLAAIILFSIKWPKTK